MKSVQRTLTLLSLAVLLFAGAALAQTASPLVRINVPFEFQVGDKTLPAGDYVIVRANPSILVLRDSRERVVATAVTIPAQALAAPAAPKLVFRATGGRNILIRLWTANSRYGYEFPAPQTGIRFAKAATTHVQVAAGR